MYMLGHSQCTHVAEPVNWKCIFQLNRLKYQNCGKPIGFTWALLLSPRAIQLVSAANALARAIMKTTKSIECNLVTDMAKF